jgi:biopolymer transport protein ExbB/TolQ
MEELANPHIIFPVFGFVAGFLLASVVFLIMRQKLSAQNAELKAQIRAEKVALDMAGAALDHRFKATAQDALQKSNEQFLQLAQERLKAAQADGSHDLDKRQKAIDELLKPMSENLKALSVLLARCVIQVRKGSGVNLSSKASSINPA